MALGEDAGVLLPLYAAQARAFLFMPIHHALLFFGQRRAAGFRKEVGALCHAAIFSHQFLLAGHADAMLGRDDGFVLYRANALLLDGGFYIRECRRIAKPGFHVLGFYAVDLTGEGVGCAVPIHDDKGAFVASGDNIAMLTHRPVKGGAILMFPP